MTRDYKCNKLSSVCDHFHWWDAMVAKSIFIRRVHARTVSTNPSIHPSICRHFNIPIPIPSLSLPAAAVCNLQETLQDFHTLPKGVTLPPPPHDILILTTTSPGSSPLDLPGPFASWVPKYCHREAAPSDIHQYYCDTCVHTPTPSGNAIHRILINIVESLLDVTYGSGWMDDWANRCDVYTETFNI